MRSLRSIPSRSALFAVAVVSAAVVACGGSDGAEADGPGAGGERDTESAVANLAAFDACERDDDCVKIERGCCERGDFIPLARTKVDAYRAALACSPATMCPMIAVVGDERVARCSAESRRCELSVR